MLKSLEVHVIFFMVLGLISNYTFVCHQKFFVFFSNTEMCSLSHIYDYLHVIVNVKSVQNIKIA